MLMLMMILVMHWPQEHWSGWLLHQAGAAQQASGHWRQLAASD